MASQALGDVVIDFAHAKGVTPAQIALAWLLAKKRQRLGESLGAAHVELSAVDVASIEAASAKVTIQGARYLEVHEKLVGR